MGGQAELGGDRNAAASGAGRSRDCADAAHARELFWTTFGRLLLLYFVPLLLLAAFFHVQYGRLVRDSRRAHLEAVAEHHTRLFDLFLRERVADLRNVADEPALSDPSRQPEILRSQLARLQHRSDAFVDLGVVDWSGALTGYAGPVRYPAGVSYAAEDWFEELVSGRRSSVLTDIYLGFRGRPHLTVALLRPRAEGVEIVRAALSPERLTQYLNSLEGSSDVHCGVVNAAGTLQLASSHLGEPLTRSSFVPPREPWHGYVRGGGLAGQPEYAYGWLTEAAWALVATPRPGLAAAPGAPRPLVFVLSTLGIFLLMGVVILIRTRQVVGRQIATERQKAELSGQLVHAAKLASVGELAAGIAHEINNPLAIISEEVGELEDSLDPQFEDRHDPPPDLREHLAAIREAVYRCRDITSKLLSFVRQSHMEIRPHDVDEILDDVLDRIMGNELLLSNVRVDRDGEAALPPILADRNQLVQVLVNLVKNAIDAMPGGGTLSVSARHRNGCIAVSLRDTGCGMTPEQRARVFTPFFTTKDPGKGTGLGLSVSYMIIQNLGGAFYVDSTPGVGSLFSVELPAAGVAPVGVGPAVEEAVWQGE